MHTRKQAIARAVSAAVAVLCFGTIGYMVIEDATFLDALYMTTITVTTIGFSEVFPLTLAGQLFTIFMAFAGIGVILLVGTEVGRVVLEGDIGQLLGIRRDLKVIKRLSDHIVVCGYGRMGSAVVDVLRSRKVAFVVVERDKDKCARMATERIPVISGDATVESVQRAANITSARAFLACLADDAHNVFAILLARQLNPSVNIIARAVFDEAEERLSMAGADKVINPYRLGGTRLALTALTPTVMDFVEASLTGSAVDLELAEIEIHDHSDLIGKTVAGADIRRRFGVLIVALKRGGKSIFNPGPDELINEGDVLVTLGPRSNLLSLEKASQ